MIWSVSTLTRSSGATRPRCTVNESMALLNLMGWLRGRDACATRSYRRRAQPLELCPLLKLPISYVGEVAGDGCRGRHHRTYQMRAATASLAAFKVAIAG